MPFDVELDEVDPELVLLVEPRPDGVETIQPDGHSPEPAIERFVRRDGCVARAATAGKVLAERDLTDTGVVRTRNVFGTTVRREIVFADVLAQPPAVIRQRLERDYPSQAAAAAHVRANGHGVETDVAADVEETGI